MYVCMFCKQVVFRKHLKTSYGSFVCTQCMVSSIAV